MASFGISDLDIGTDETFDFVCTVCKKKNRNTEADKFCADCQDYYCSTCVKVHDDVPVLQARKILDKTQFKPGTSVSFPVVPTERCKEHGHMPVNMYCQEHDVVGYSSCMVVKHSDCKEKYYVPEYITNTKRPDIRAVMVKLDEILKSMKDLKEDFMNEKKMLTDKRDTVLKMIQDFREEINQRLDELEQTTIQQAEHKFQALVGEMEAKLREIKVVTSEVETALHNLQSSGENLPDLFVGSTIAREVTSRAERIISVSTGNKSATVVDVTFQKNKTLSSLLNEIQALGILDTRDDTERSTEREVAISSIRKSKEFLREPKQDTDQTPVTRALNKERVSVRVKSDKRSSDITGACVLDDRTIIIIDSSNSNLKRLEGPKYNVKDICYLPNYPWQVCVTSQQEAAATCGWSQTIQFVAVRHSLTKTRQISTGFPCCGLAYADGKLYVADYHTSVYVYTIAGDRLQQFDINQYGRELSYVKSLAVNSDGSRIYVSYFQKGLLILGKSGKLVGQFCGTELQGGYGVCLYKYGNILVCGHESKNVLQFSAEGKLIGEVMKTDGLCKSVCCDTNFQKLLISFPEDKIEFYDLH